MANVRRAWSHADPLTLQTMSLTNSTAVAINSTGQTAHILHLSVESNDVRYRGDGTAPTLTTGVLLQKDMDYWFLNYNGTSQLKFQRDTGSATIHIQPYQYVNE